MAQTLSSPGVNVSVIDQSFYTPAAPGTVPLVFVATAENKANASASGTAVGTTKANAGTVWVITSQRDLTETFGTPYFQTDSGNNSVHASEISEYGLQAAYSVLGVSSRAYVVRADVDLGSLTGSALPPTSAPSDGTYWVDTASTAFGINEWSTSTQTLTVKTPKIINDSNAVTATVAGSGVTPDTSFGTPGDYAVVLTKANASQLWYKAAGGWTEVVNTFDSGKRLIMSPHYQYPDFSGAANNSVWVKTTTPGQGSNWVVKQYSETTGLWSTISAPMFGNTQSAIQSLDSTGGGKNIPVGTLFIDYDFENGAQAGAIKANFKLWRRKSTSPTTLSVTASAVPGSGGTVYIRQTDSTGAWNTPFSLTITTSGAFGSQFAAALNTSVYHLNLSANYDVGTGILTVTHALGGDFEITNLSTYVSLTGVSSVYEAPVGDRAIFTGSPTQVSLVTNWAPATFQALSTAPIDVPADSKLWYNTDVSSIDILYNNGAGAWVGYHTAGAFPSTDSNGPILASIAPTVNSQNNALVTGDIWVDSSNPDMYGQDIYVYNSTLAAGKRWVKQDVTDNFSPNGWLFADARWSSTSTTNMQTLTPISTMLTSNYVDPDCPNPSLYPKGMRLFNTRRSGNNVKKYYTNFIGLNYLDGNPRQGGETTANYAADRWVTASGSAFGRLAQRAVVVSALKALVATNESVRDTDTLNYNLIATPGYTELISSMITLNTDIGQLALVVGDAPFRLKADATSLQKWGSNATLATDNGDDALVSHDPYTAVYYPSGFTNDNRGNSIVVPPSHMMLTTIINSDNVSYPWFAPAGTRRGGITNASSVGYVDSTTGKFKTASLYEPVRNVLAGVEVNAIATLPGAGLTVMGQYTRAASTSSLDRVNVARLVTYLRRQLGVLAKPYLFEPNDSQTRKDIKSNIESLLSGLITQRALYDFVVVCDQTNNTNARIDRNELWVDIAIEPVKSVEFIYIPLRLLNTGAIASGNFGSQLSGNSTTSSGQ
jgi:hypothetical protein